MSHKNQQSQPEPGQPHGFGQQQISPLQGVAGFLLFWNEAAEVMTNAQVNVLRTQLGI